jgi:hypothetical protein
MIYKSYKGISQHASNYRHTSIARRLEIGAVPYASSSSRLTDLMCTLNDVRGAKGADGALGLSKMRSFQCIQKNARKSFASAENARSREYLSRHWKLILKPVHSSAVIDATRPCFGLGEAFQGMSIATLQRVQKNQDSRSH